MLLEANTDLNPLIPKAYNSECQNLLCPLQNLQNKHAIKSI